MYAIIKTGGKQYKVVKGDVLKVEKLNAEVDSNVEISEVLMVGGESLKIGTPFVSGAKVTAKVLSHGKWDKVISFNYKPKKRVRVKNGHRQPYTEIQIEAINA